MNWLDDMSGHIVDSAPFLAELAVVVFTKFENWLMGLGLLSSKSRLNLNFNWLTDSESEHPELVRFSVWFGSMFAVLGWAIN